MNRSRLLGVFCVLGLTLITNYVQAAAVVTSSTRTLLASTTANFGSPDFQSFTTTDPNVVFFGDFVSASSSGADFFYFCDPVDPTCVPDFLTYDATAQAVQSSFLAYDPISNTATVSAQIQADLFINDPLGFSTTAQAQSLVDVSFDLSTSYNYALTLELVGSDAVFDVIGASGLTFNTPGNYSVAGVIGPGSYTVHANASANYNAAPFLLALAAPSAFAPGTQSGVGFNFGISAVPVPPALWLFGSGLMGLVGIARKKA